jgi:arginyl-tRNA--protein-N-Asp/Glu arginylyltransferase
MTDKSTRLLHRRNEDGAYNSICRTCLAAVACSMATAELAENQKTRVCNSAFLAERGCMSRAESMRPPAAPTFQCYPRTD